MFVFYSFACTFCRNIWHDTKNIHSFFRSVGAIAEVKMKLIFSLSWESFEHSLFDSLDLCKKGSFISKRQQQSTWI